MFLSFLYKQHKRQQIQIDTVINSTGFPPIFRLKNMNYPESPCEYRFVLAKIITLCKYHGMELDLGNYKKIYIIGATGSGKTTLARKLSKKLGYPHFETDVIKWNHKTKAKRPESERMAILNKILSENDTWIIEGAQWQDWTDAIWRDCDVAVMPNPSVLKRIFRNLKRHFLREESKSKQMSLRDLWNNILFSFRFRKYYLPIFQTRARKYEKQIVEPAEMNIV